jgi:hypothetical protein
MNVRGYGRQPHGARLKGPIDFPAPTPRNCPRSGRQTDWALDAQCLGRSARSSMIAAASNAAGIAAISPTRHRAAPRSGHSGAMTARTASRTAVDSTSSGRRTRPVPAFSHASAFSNWSAPCGASTSGRPAANDAGSWLGPMVTTTSSASAAKAGGMCVGPRSRVPAAVGLFHGRPYVHRARHRRAPHRPPARDQGWRAIGPTSRTPSRHCPFP